MSASIVFGVLGWAITAWAAVALVRFILLSGKVHKWCEFVYHIGMLEIDHCHELTLAERHYEAVNFTITDMLFKLGDWGGGPMIIKDLKAITEVKQITEVKLPAAGVNVDEALAERFKEAEKGED